MSRECVDGRGLEGSKCDIAEDLEGSHFLGWQDWEADQGGVSWEGGQAG